jgi:glycyl-tRNA synthetase beta chain
MYWRESLERFVRPLHYIVALFGGQVIPFELAGVQSDSYTRGHLILAPERFRVASFAELESGLATAFVLIDPRQRRQQIEAQLAASVPAGHQMLQDRSLLDEIAHLVEYPQVLLGEFEERFLALPREILVTVLKKHQKYFSLTDSEGNIRPYFLTVMNTAATSPDLIRKGHQRVLRARLEDAAFYREFDRRRKLEERVALLEAVTFQKKLGSYGEKVRRLQPLAQHLAAAVSENRTAELDTAVRLCKADLTTEMVKEFTELQGIVGGLYARDEQYPEEVWQAVYQHYQPLSAEGSIPDSALGKILSVADKTDTLCGSFGLGIIPTGSSDPFSLRRFCQGIVRIAWEGRLSFSLLRLFEKSLELLHNKIQRNSAETSADLMDFVGGRVRYLLAEKGLQHDVIEAVMAAGFDDLVDLWQRAEAVQAIRRDPDFEAIATSFKRIRNIIGESAAEEASVSESLLQEAAEKALCREIEAREPAIRTDLERREYYQALKTLAQVRPALDHFFDKVLVMSEDASLRRNRLLLLRRLAALYRKVGDLSLISAS